MKKITAIILSVLVIICCFVGIASATTIEHVTNGDFSNGLNGWSIDTTSGSTVTVYDSGNKGARLQAKSQNLQYTTGRASISQSIDLTGVSQITWKTMPIGTSSQASYVMYIYKDNTAIARYTWSDLGTEGQFNTHSYTIGSPLTGSHTLKFEATAYSGEMSTAANTVIVLDDISATSTYTPPSVTNVNYLKSGVVTNSPLYLKGDTVTVRYTLDAGTAANAGANIVWGDGVVNSLTIGTAQTITHTYTSEGSYIPEIQVVGDGALVDTVTLSKVYIISIDFNADITSTDPGNPITFQATGTIPSDTSISSYAWNFGDSGTGTGNIISHTYTTSGTYSVSLTITLSAGSGYTETVSKANYITTAAQTVSFNQTSVSSGDTVTVSWSLRDANYPYTLNIYPSSNTGIASSYTSVYSYTINSASQTSTSFTAGSAGYYTAYIEKNGNRLTYTSTPVNVVTLITLTVNVYNDGAPYITDATTVTLFKSDGTQIGSQTTTQAQSGDYSNTVQFANINTGEYYVTISAANQTTRTSPTLQLTDSYSLQIDFTLGSSDTSLVGAGSMYATTFVTFRTQDSGTGRYIPGVQIVAKAVQPTNAWEYFANLFGASLGTVIQSMTLTGVSDQDGRITFAMYQNVRYNLNITYAQGGKYYHEERSFQQSALSGEYLIEIPLTDTSGQKITENLVTEVTTDGDQIITNFTDNSGTVSQCKIIVYKKIGDERHDLNMSIVDYPQQGIPNSHTFSPENPSGSSYIVSFVITSSEYGTKTQEYGVTFAGVAVKLGDIPNEWYIWISFAILLMTGAVATFVNSRHFAIVVCIVATLLFFAGWLNAIGAAAPIALVICYVLTIVYYIANNHNGGS